MLCIFSISGNLAVSPVIQEQFGVIGIATARITCHFTFCFDPSIPTSDSVPCCSNLSWSGPALDSPTASERVVSLGTASELTIRSLRTEDEGQYYCICDGAESTRSTLIVRSKLAYSYNIRAGI